ncbi:MAG: cyanoexosortase A system-associated protein [Acaryochloris sp. RU_4_1]|nr:cyanoexosortase A system-associated protein [Acaryochloris sp. RU_4_1]
MSPSLEQEAARTFVFPTGIPLPGWQPSGSEELNEPSGHIYRYGKDGHQLDLQMYYVIDANTNQKYFRQYDPTSTDVSTTIIQRENQQGFYRLSTEKNRAYLRACIDPQGRSTITYDQFIRNRYVNDLQFRRILPWILGQVTLRDHRCLWTHLSVPIQGTSPDPAYEILEVAWVPWQRWWKSHFPGP